MRLGESRHSALCFDKNRWCCTRTRVVGVALRRESLVLYSNKTRSHCARIDVDSAISLGHCVSLHLAYSLMPESAPVHLFRIKVGGMCRIMQVVFRS